MWGNGKSVKLHLDLSHEVFGLPFTNIRPELFAPGYVGKMRDQCRQSTLSVLAFVESIGVCFSCHLV